jgi:hypothetical protein
MDELFEREMDDDPSEKVPEQTSKAAPLESSQNRRM